MIDLKNVIKIGKERIKYRNEQGNEAYIELASSANTWAHRHPEIERQEGAPLCVGDCVTDKKNAYIEFYNIGHVKIGVRQSVVSRLFAKGLSDTQKERFEKFKAQLEANGYTIYNIQ